MKKLYVILGLMLITLAGYGQLKVTQSVRYYRGAQFDESPTIPAATGDYKALQLKQAVDSFLLQRDTALLSDYIAGADAQLAKFRGDSAVIGMSNGSNGQVMSMVSGEPEWASLILFAMCPADQSTSSTSLVNISGLSLALAAGATYQVTFVLGCVMSTDTDGAGFGLNLTSTTGAGVLGVLTGSANSTSSKSVSLSVFNTASSPWLETSSQTGGVVFNGVVTTGSTAPTLTVMFMHSNAVGSTTVKSRSYVIATKIN